MKELLHIRNKVNARIKSIGDDPQAMYAKKMMRRCIKDIDAVIDAKKVTGEVAKCKTPLDRFNEGAEEVRVNVNSDGVSFSNTFGDSLEGTRTAIEGKGISNIIGEIALGDAPIVENPMWNKLLNETLLSKKQQERFDTLYEFLRRGRISEEFFLSSILDSTI